MCIRDRVVDGMGKVVRGLAGLGSVRDRGGGRRVCGDCACNQPPVPFVPKAWFHLESLAVGTTCNIETRLHPFPPNKLKLSARRISHVQISKTCPEISPCRANSNAYLQKPLPFGQPCMISAEQLVCARLCRWGRRLSSSRLR
eukprot:6183564-Pleurochrysis_carterae.AAC.1